MSNIYQEFIAFEKRAVAKGFAFPNPHGMLDKVAEELEEIRQEVESGNHEAFVEEVGDLLVAALSLEAYYDVDVTKALEGAFEKFQRRITYLDQKAKEQGLEDYKAWGVDQMMAYWKEAKAHEKEQRKAA